MSIPPAYAMDTSQSDLLKDAESFVADARAFKGDRAQRIALLNKLELMTLQLEHPMDSLMSQWISIHVVTALNFMVETGAFEKMPLEGSITGRELSTLVGIDETAIVRLMRILVGVGIVEETGRNTYAHTPRSREYLPGKSVDFFKMCTSMIPCYLSLPKYFTTHTSSDLLDQRKTPFSYYKNSEGKTFYEVLKDNPAEHEIFNRGMKQQEPFLPTLGMFPFSSIKEQVEAEKDRPFIVDVGGGRGHMLQIIGKDTNEGYGAKLILQDRPEVIASVSDEELPGIDKMSYDFFTPQPIKNAHIYYLRRIMHNYQDEVCIEILKNQAAAMGPTSRLLIGEVVLPSRTKVAGEMTGYWKDVVMLVIGGKERSPEGFAKILEAAGLQLVKVWPFEAGEQAVVEARLKITL